MVAHPDDAEWGCSGTVAKWCAEGWEVVYVLCTDGSKGSDDPEMTSEKLVQIRAQEQRDAGQSPGIEPSGVPGLRRLDAGADPGAAPGHAREIRRHRPDVLICNSPVRSLDEHGYVGHPDHFASGEAALSAVFPTARDRLTFPELLEEGLEPHKVREVWVAEHHEANLYVDVSGYIDQAIAALKCHRSQVSDEDAEVHLPAWRARIGEQVGFKYAEAYRRFRL